jgi:hypothetical protein
VWQAIAVWTGGLILTPDAGVQLMDWWEKALSQLPKKIRKLKASVMIYGAWNIWKARNRRVFDQKVLTPVDVLHEVQMEMKCRSLAAVALSYLLVIMFKLFSILSEFEFLLFHVISRL